MYFVRDFRMRVGSLANPSWPVRCYHFLQNIQVQFNNVGFIFIDFLLNKLLSQSYCILIIVYGVIWFTFLVHSKIQWRSQDLGSGGNIKQKILLKYSGKIFGNLYKIRTKI